MKVDKALNQVKDALLANTTMAYFDPKLSTELIVDASPLGLEAILVQDK